MQTRFIKKQILVSREEDQLIRQKAEQVGMNVSAYMRSRALDYNPKEKPPKEFYDAIKEIRKVGINLNQIAHKANALNFIDVPYYKKQVEICQLLVIQLYIEYGGEEVKNEKEQNSKSRNYRNNLLVNNCIRCSINNIKH